MVSFRDKRYIVITNHKIWDSSKLDILEYFIFFLYFKLYS